MLLQGILPASNIFLKIVCLRVAQFLRSNKPHLVNTKARGTKHQIENNSTVKQVASVVSREAILEKYLRAVRSTCINRKLAELPKFRCCGRQAVCCTSACSPSQQFTALTPCILPVEPKMELDLATLQEIFGEKLAPGVVRRIHNSCSPQAAWEELVRLTESEAADPTPDSTPGPELSVKHLHMTEKGHQRTKPERTWNHAVSKLALATATPVRLSVNTCDSEIHRVISVGATPHRGVVDDPKLPPPPLVRNRGAHSCGHSHGYDYGNRPEPISIVKSRQYWPLDGCRLPLPTDKHGAAASTLSGDHPVSSEDTSAPSDFLANIMPMSLPVASGSRQVRVQPSPDSLPAQLGAKLALVDSPENGGAWTPPAQSSPSRSRSPMAGGRISSSGSSCSRLPTPQPFRPPAAADIRTDGQPPAGASSDTRTAAQVCPPPERETLHKYMSLNGW